MLFKKVSSAPSEKVGGELVILDAESDLIFSSNEVGAFLWGELENPISLDDLCIAVLDKFKGAQSNIVKADVIEFIDTLLERNLVERVVH